MAEHFLDGAQVCAFFQHVGAEGVAQSVWVDVGRESFGNGDLLDDASYAACGEAPSPLVDEKRRSVLAEFRQGSLPRGEIERPSPMLRRCRREHSVLSSLCRGSESPRR